MSKVLAAGSGVLSIAAVMLALWTAAENRALRKQLEEQQLLAPRDEAALGAEVAQDQPAGALAKAGGTTLPERLAALEERVAKLPEADPDAPAPLAPLPPVVEVPPAAPAPPAPGVKVVPGGAAGGPGAPAGKAGRSEAEIQKQVKDAVAKELESIKRREKKRATFAEFTQELKLNETQQIEVQDELARMQLEVLALLRTPTTGGHVPLDSLLEAWSDPDRQAGNRKYAAAVEALKQTTVPGTEQTYQQQIDALKASVHKPFERVMTAEQYAVWKSWEIDPSRISWTDSPFHQELLVVTEEMRKRREAALKDAGAGGGK